MKNSSHWMLALFASLALMVSNGMTLSGLSVYDLEFIDAFSWSMGDIKLRDMITLTLTGLSAPFAGVLIDRYGVRRCMLVGWLTLGLGYLCYSRLDTLFQMYAIHAAFALVLVTCGLNAVVILVSSWFLRFRGTAIGIALVGTSLGGALFPQYGTAMIQAVGWRTAFSVAALIPAALFFITLFWVRDHPSGRGLSALGESSNSGSARMASGGVAFADALRTRTFWAFALFAMATFYTVLGVQSHVYKYMRDAGFDAQVATNAISLFFLSALAGKFVFGIVSDLLDSKKVLYANLLVMLAGAVLLARMDPAQVWLAVTAFGLGWGGAYTLLQLSVMNTFGIRDAGKILGTITILDATGGGLGIWLTGLIYDAAGSYEIPFAIFCGLIVFALLCLTQARPVNAPPAG
ncbi:MAG: MFS transporter [Pseudomonadales bacterium]|nr:MFS transporter [Halioglobus sp.]MCP5128755.1 MFS transporter [Pseudomonadales bacterium]